MSTTINKYDLTNEYVGQLVWIKLGKAGMREQARVGRLVMNHHDQLCFILDDHRVFTVNNDQVWHDVEL